MKEDNHQVIIEELEEICLLIFTIKGCQTCQILKSNISQLKNSPKVYILDKNTGKILAKKYCIITVPTVVLIKNKEEIDRFYGNKSMSYIESFLKQNEII